MKQFSPIHLVFYIGFLASLAVSCTSIDLFEKSANIPGHAWSHSFRPSFQFEIRDTTRPYRIYLVLRHNEKYNYNNIYVNLLIKAPGIDSVIKRQGDLQLATNEKGWLASGMDDIYEHRIVLAEENLKAGNYQFTLEQIMREDPLQNVLDAGIRIEKQ